MSQDIFELYKEPFVDFVPKEQGGVIIRKDEDGVPYIGAMKAHPSFALRKCHKEYIVGNAIAGGGVIQNLRYQDVKLYNQFCKARFSSKIEYHWWKANFEYYLKDNFMESTYKLLFGWDRTTGKEYEAIVIHSLLENKEVINEVEKDGLINIIPIVNILGQSPCELKRTFGKSEWKGLANNTKTRNRDIMVCVSKALNKVVYRRSPVNNGDVVKLITELNQLKSSILHNYPSYCDKPSYLIGMSNTVTLNNVSKRYTLARDTELNGGSVNYKWSCKRLEEEHDKYLSEVKRKRKKAKLLDHSVEFCEPYTYSNGGYVGVLLNTKGKVFSEGDEMHHCVGDFYSGSCAEGRYSAFSIEGLERATLGCRRMTELSGKSVLTFDQLYGKCNSKVSDEVHRFCNNLIEDYNKGTQ